MDAPEQAAGQNARAQRINLTRNAIFIQESKAEL
jgi:hypothetical protein